MYIMTETDYEYNDSTYYKIGDGGVPIVYAETLEEAAKLFLKAGFSFYLDNHDICFSEYDEEGDSYSPEILKRMNWSLDDYNDWYLPSPLSKLDALDLFADDLNRFHNFWLLKNGKSILNPKELIDKIFDLYHGDRSWLNL